MLKISPRVKLGIFLEKEIPLVLFLIFVRLHETLFTLRRCRYRLHGKHSSANTLAHTHLTMNSAGPILGHNFYIFVEFVVGSQHCYDVVLLSINT